MGKERKSRKEEILEAALQEFIKEGVSGARMQAMADNIGVTKAMIHYYFKTKENLFEEVFHEASQNLVTGLMNVLESDMPLFKKIEAFIDGTLDRFNQNPKLVGFVVNELNKHPEITTELFREISNYNAAVFDEQLQQAADNYEIAPVEGNQVVANILSLCMFPYLGEVFLKEMLASQKEEEYEQFLARRREVIKDTIINWLAG